MKCLIHTACIVFAATLFPFYISAQSEDVRHATGLPIQIGQPVIYGHVKVRGLAPNEPKPSIYVSLFVSGAQVDRARTNDQGYYYFLRSVSDASTLVFEANNNELGRIVLTSSISTTVRRDVEFDWRSGFQNVQSPAGVISVKNAYVRSPDNQKAFDDALAVAKAKRTDEAIELFRKLIDKDPKDFVAWTELGSLYFGSDKFTDAENAYNKALAQKGDFMLALMNLGKLQYSQKHLDQAIVTFTRAATADPNSAEAFHYLGESYLQAKLGSKAVVALNEAIRLAPIEKADLHLRLATLYNAAGVRDRAANEYKLFLGKKPQHPDKKKLEEYIKDNAK